MIFISAKQFQLRTYGPVGIKNILYIRMVYLYQLEIRKKDIVSEVCFKYLENFNYYEYLNSISFHPPVMIITTLVFFYIRRKILLKGEKH